MKTENQKWNWWYEVKNRTEELSYPIITLTVLTIEIILAITYIFIIITAISMILNTILKLI